MPGNHSYVPGLPEAIKCTESPRQRTNGPGVSNCTCAGAYSTTISNGVMMLHALTVQE